MIKVSRLFLLGFVASTLAGPASAQGAITGLTGALADTGASGAAALGGMPRSDLKLNISASELNQAANAVSASSAHGVIGGASKEGISTAKLGTFGGTGGQESASLFTNALPSGNAFANALGTGGSKAEGGESPISGVNAVAALGVEKSSLANALGGQGAIATQRIGQ